MQNSNQSIFDYFRPDLNAQELVEEIFRTTPVEEIAFYLRYINRILIGSDEFCQMNKSFRAETIFLLDLLQCFFERVGQGSQAIE